MQLERFARFIYQPVLPLGKNRSFVTNSKSHWDLARQIATEGTVLLKNDGALPLGADAKICLFGLGAGEFMLGGGGSGRVFTEKLITLADGLEAAAARGACGFFKPTVDFYVQAVQDIIDRGMREHPEIPAIYLWRKTFRMPLPELPEDLYQQAKSFGNTAIFCVSRYSSEGDTGGDRHGGKGDFYLLDEEQALLSRLCRDFEKVIVVLNTCGAVSTREYRDNPKVGAVLYPLFGGGISGESLTQILLGEAYPSGHLQFTLANRLEDYPSTKDFHADKYYVNYTEDIFVGYRYFETFAPDAVVYPFGFGLGYTTFETETRSAVLEKNTVKLEVAVTNTGKFPGKEVVQAYLTAPQGKLGKAKKVLCAFGKTKELLPGQEAVVKLHFDIREFGSFDDLGKIAECAFVLEQGQYIVQMGTNVRNTQPCLEFTLEQDVICRRCKPYMAPRQLPERLTASGKMEALPAAVPVAHKPKGLRLKAAATEDFALSEALETDRLKEFLATLTDEDLIELTYGHPMMNISNTFGIGAMPRYAEDRKEIPLVPTADGPAGLRVREGRGVSPTFFPSGSTVAQTWNLPLVRRMGAAAAREIKENNIGIWLAPGMNIQRNPMCGRNFEYYSEDPLTTGLLAASCVSGVQSQNIAATIKHFCCNNRENDRRLADSRVSQRALREIYLRGFEIAIKKAKPWALMTSYNPVNGEQMSANWEALNGILRSEWNYDGVVMTDWRTLSNLEDEIHAGGDVKMPMPVTLFYDKKPDVFDPMAMLQDGRLDRSALRASAYRVLKMMAHFE